ncbi:3-isopropylmalate/(R)-2-methylmalate dehydratase large subunit [Amycolatopsis bartoniae]|uniref:3-isopropylmalate dehydratase large subunit n=1 Tax=Amycolatopsis bartoniae TaxID=941986 RepID=A0A8H9M6T2_9PSEU|nr:3-isopropylmalate dehydratase large subunit [Amycolatopsis bartoniae]MBB2936545.1 3-isopropylmalate/(R)-2-methylmalate dehydratase large subunit [Amycolatopsis bartoniae]TVT10982.1 3-isopropylmalate dehydratase large subunit [Amycolatopsis bartoniae]GHF68144.1 3-isopropylmalate dehydratase large subunit [Amycolatopsis bartoniae]
MATLLDKIWDAHLVHRGAGGTDLLYVDFHLLHEGSSPQAFEGLRLAGRRVRRPDLTLATEDHVVPTRGRLDPSGVAATMVEALRRNCAEFGVPLHRSGTDGQGIVHVIGPELGISQPGRTILCGDSHTSTHGAFGALAFGIGTSQVEHVLATQTIAIAKPRSMAVTLHGVLPPGVSAKDVALAIIGRIGTGGAQGHVIEYRGPAVEAMSMESRLTLCNMSIESGAKAGMIAPDAVTLDYVRGRPYAPAGKAWDDAVARWASLRSDDDAEFDRSVDIDVTDLSPFVTWGTNPSQVVELSGVVPDPAGMTDPADRRAAERALTYLDLTPGTPMREIPIDVVFLGSCTNGRIEDLRAAAELLDGHRIAPGVRMLVVPGSAAVRRAAEAEGLDEVFRKAGAQWRTAGCSLCVAMNDDSLAAGERCASTSNRNFEGRQGRGGRTHLVSPSTAAATALTGRLTAPSTLGARR